MSRNAFVFGWFLCVALALGSGCGGPAEGPAPAQTAAPAENAAVTPEPAPVPEPPAAEPAAATEPARTVQVYRDTWGIPHIFAESPADAAYAVGYVQAEDRLDDLYLNLRTGLGRRAEVIGKDGLETDIMIHTARVPQSSQRCYEKAPEELKAILEAYIAGVAAYEAEYPDAAPDYAFELEPWHPITLGRLMQMRWAMGLVMDDLKKAPKEAPAFGSNQWAVSPSRSAGGCAILCTDPHQTWEGPSRFHEARVHGGRLQMNGMFIVGTPLMGFGHTQHLGWAPTTGGPDVGDVLLMKIDPEAEPVPKYQYDGEWFPLEMETVTIRVKDDDPMELPVMWTRHGPIIPSEELPAQMAEGYAYAAASPYLEPVSLFEQVYAMCMAHDADEFYEALRHDAFIQQNLMYADTKGNIGYIRSGRTYVRPEGDFNWRAPVPGWTSETAYQGLHALEDFVQIVNPKQGYMQNVNISPENMMVDSPLTPDKYPDYLYNVTWDFDNPRSRRLVPLLDAHDAMTAEQAKAIVLDVYDILAEPWQKALRDAVDTAGGKFLEDKTFRAAVEGILNWDGRFTRQATATTLYRTWRLAAGKEVDVTPIREGRDVEMAQQILLLQALEDAIEEMVDTYGRWDVPWGDIHKVGRGGQLYPVGGAEFGGNSDAPNMTETLFDVRTKPGKDNPGQYIAYSGSFRPMLMFMRPGGIESYSLQQWGNSSDPDSPHYMDQGKRLYSQRELKPTWWDRESLMPNVESEQTLDVQ